MALSRLDGGKPPQIRGRPLGSIGGHPAAPHYLNALPPWLWDRGVKQFLAEAQLPAVTSTGSGNERVVEVGTVERLDRTDPHLVRVTDVINPAGDPKPHVLVDAEQQPSVSISLTADQAQQELQQMSARTGPTAGIGLLAPAFGLFAALATFSAPELLVDQLNAIRDALLGMRVQETNEPICPPPSVHFMQRSPALLHRRSLTAILLRLEQDTRLTKGDVSQLSASLSEGELIFSSSRDLGDGLILFDAYLAPLLGAMSPFVWVFPAKRASGSGTLIFNLGRPISGTYPAALEVLQLLPSRTPATVQNAPALPPRAGPAALRWWSKRLEKLLAVSSDPAVFAPSDGTYVPIKQVHALLSVEQVFNRVAAIQQLHRNPQSPAGPALQHARHRRPPRTRGNINHRAGNHGAVECSCRSRWERDR